MLKLSKIVSFVQFFADVSKTLEALIAIYVHGPGSSCFVLIENGISFCAMI